MSKEGGLGQQFYMHGLDISGDVATIDEASSPRPMELANGINSSAQERILLRSDGRIAFTTFFNDAAGQAHGELSALPRTDAIVLWLTGGAVDDPAAGLVAKQVGYDPTHGQDGSLRLSVECLGANGSPLEWGEMLTSGLDTFSSASASSSRDDGASTSKGARAYLAIDDIDSGTPTVVLQDSANDSSWATLISFTAVADGAEPVAERKTVTGTVDRYLRLNVTGTFSNLDCAVMVQRGTAEDDVDLS